MSQARRWHETFTSAAQVTAIGHGLRDRTLPKASWTHRAHFAAAIWLVSHRDAEQAERQMPALIRAYNEATGVANTETAGYHETITLASIKAAASALADDPRHGIHEACNRLLLSPCADPAGCWPIGRRSVCFRKRRGAGGYHPI